MLQPSHTPGVMRGLDPRIHEAMQRLRPYRCHPLRIIMDCRVIGERSDAVLRPAMPGNDDGEVAARNLPCAGDLMNRPSGLKIQTKLVRSSLPARWCDDAHSRGETRMRKIVLTL